MDLTRFVLVKWFIINKSAKIENMILLPLHDIVVPYEHLKWYVLQKMLSYDFILLSLALFFCAILLQIQNKETKLCTLFFPHLTPSPV
jgi:hypothetical protein